MIKVKICGITTKEALKASVSNDADFVGFVFFESSPRYISPKKAKKLTEKLPKKIKKVAVIVDLSISEIKAIIKYFKPDYLQLHGKETLNDVKRIKEEFSIPIIKAIKVKSSDDISKSLKYKDHVDMMLFDSKAPSYLLPGGNGLSFDWSLLKLLKKDSNWFLSGGLSLNNIEKALKTSGAAMVDVSSGLESSPGVKDPELIKLFLNKVKKNSK